jgi:phosphate-selective porin OprO/OprP
MRPNVAQLGALAVLALIAVGLATRAEAQVAYAANTIQSLFYKEFQKDGRFYVFNDAKKAAAFEQSGEVGTGLTRLGAGPNGETVVADSETALELFAFKYGLSLEVERPKPPTLNIVWRDGKTRMTLGSNFYLELSNRIQVRYTQEFPDDRVKLPGTENPGDSRGSFRIRRAKLKFEGWFYKSWMQYEVQTNWPGISSTNLGNYLEDANLNVDFSKGQKRFMVKLGQFKVPFGTQELTSSGSQQFVDRSFTSNFYFRGRDQGLQLWGTFNNKIEYRAGLFNGNGITRSANDNSKFQFNGYLRFQPNGAVPMAVNSGALLSESDFESRAAGRPLYAFGAAYEHNDNSFVDADPTKNLKSDLFTVDAIFKYKGFSAVGAYTWGKRKNQTATAEFDTSGFYAQAGYFLRQDKWEIAARYGETDPSDLVPLDKVKELRGGVNYFYNKHAYKVQLDFGRIETASAAGSTKNNELRIQTQFIF